MSKYNALWEYVQKNGSQSFRLTFEEIQDIALKDQPWQGYLQLKFPG